MQKADLGSVHRMNKSRTRECVKDCVVIATIQRHVAILIACATSATRRAICAADVSRITQVGPLVRVPAVGQISGRKQLGMVPERQPLKPGGRHEQLMNYQ